MLALALQRLDVQHAPADQVVDDDGRLEGVYLVNTIDRDRIARGTSLRLVMFLDEPCRASI